MKLAWLVATLSAVSWSASAQTPCDRSPATTPVAVTVTGTNLCSTMPWYSLLEPDGTPSVTGFRVGYQALGAVSPTVEAAIAKALFVSVGGDCYCAPAPNLGAVPIGQVYVPVLRSMRGTEASQWSPEENSDRFFLQAPLIAPSLLRVVRP
jgi:hypothetical protein